MPHLEANYGMQFLIRDNSSEKLSLIGKKVM